MHQSFQREIRSSLSQSMLKDQIFSFKHFIINVKDPKNPIRANTQLKTRKLYLFVAILLEANVANSQMSKYQKSSKLFYAKPKLCKGHFLF